MKKSLLVLWAFSFINGSLIAQAETQVITRAKCEKLYAKADIQGSVRHQKLLKDHKPFEIKIEEGFRAWVTRKLLVINEDPYPYVDKSETPLAYAWALHSFGRLSPDQLKLIGVDKIDVEKIQQDLNNTLLSVQSFHKKQTDLIDAIANNEIEQRVLNGAVGRVEWQRFLGFLPYPTMSTAVLDFKKRGSVQAELPYYKDGVLHEAPSKSLESESAPGGEAKPAEPGRKEYYGGVVQTLIEAKKNVARETARFEAELKALESKQADDIQKLEVYVHEFRRQASLGPAKDETLLAPVKRFIEGDATKDGEGRGGVDSLYVSGVTDGVLKPEYLPPYYTWNAWRWHVFMKQAASILKRKHQTLVLPKADPKQRFTLENFWNLLQSLNDQEKRALGVGNVLQVTDTLKKSFMAKAVTWTGRTTWSIIKHSRWLLTFGGVGLVTNEMKEDEFGMPLIEGAYHAFMANWNKRQACIEAKNDDELANCVLEYLEMRFPREYFQHIVGVNPLVENSKILNPKVVELIEDIKSERRRFLLQRKRPNMVRGAVKRALVNAYDPTSDAFRKRLITSENEDDMWLSFSSSTGPISYLAANFPEEYDSKEIQNLVREAIENRDDAPMLKRILQRLKENPLGGAIADEVEKFMRDRLAYVQTKQAVLELDKRIDENLSVDRGTAPPATPIPANPNP